MNKTIVGKQTWNFYCCGCKEGVLLVVNHMDNNPSIGKHNIISSKIMPQVKAHSTFKCQSKE